MRKFALALAILLGMFPLFGLVGCSKNIVEKAAKDLDEYTIDMSLDPHSMSVAAVQTFKYTHRHSQEVSDLKFNLFAAVYASDSAYPPVPAEEKLAAYPNGYSYGNITLDRITVNGEEVPFVIDDGMILCVPIQEGLHKGESATLTMDYSIKLANILHRLGYGENTINLGNFFPILCYFDGNGFRTDGYYAVGDPFVSECANYSVSVTLPEGYDVAATANMTKQVNTTSVTYAGTAKAVRDFALVISKSFETASATHKKAAVNYYYFSDENPQQTLSLCTDAVKFFSRLLCDYPYPSLSVAQSDFCYGGMEYPCLVMVSADCERKQYMLAIVHEIAHQWVYGLVGNDQINDAFMDEGLAEYLTYRFFDEYGDYGISGKELVNQHYGSFVTYLDIMKGHASSVNTSLRPVSEYSSWRAYAYTTYVKGCIMFYELEKMMGRANFDKGLKSYVEDNVFTIASRKSLFDHFGKAYGCAIDDWFCSLLEGKDIFLPPSE